MILMKDIIDENHPNIRKVAQPVEFPLSEEDQVLVEDLQEFLLNSQDEELAEKYGLRPGVGIAAPQVNQLKQIFALHVTEYDEKTDEFEPILSEVMINPKIVSHSVQQAALRNGEGCLSVNRDVPGLVPRHQIITIEYLDAQGNSHRKRLRGYEAIVVQHEYDHLLGKLFYDHIDPVDPWGEPEGIRLI